jgi:hypothetical protein
MPNRKSVKKAPPKLPQLQWQWGMLCSLSSLDQERNNISMFNVIDQLTLPSTTFRSDEQPVGITLEHELITSWRRTLPATLEDREFVGDVIVELVDPHENVLQSVTMPIILPSNGRRARQRICLPGVRFTIPGDYCYRVKIVDSVSGDEGQDNFVHFEVFAK